METNTQNLIEQIRQAESIEELEVLEPREDRGKRGVMTMWSRWPQEVLIRYARKYVELAGILNTGEFEKAHEGLRKKILRIDNDSDKDKTEWVLHKHVLPQPSLGKIWKAETKGDLIRARNLGVKDWKNFSDEMVIEFAIQACMICDLDNNDLSKGGEYQDLGKKLRRIGAFEHVVSHPVCALQPIVQCDTVREMNQVRPSQIKKEVESLYTQKYNALVAEEMHSASDLSEMPEADLELVSDGVETMFLRQYNYLTKKLVRLASSIGELEVVEIQYLNDEVFVKFTKRYCNLASIEDKAELNVYDPELFTFVRERELPELQEFLSIVPAVRNSGSVNALIAIIRKLSADSQNLRWSRLSDLELIEFTRSYCEIKGISTSAQLKQECAGLYNALQRQGSKLPEESKKLTQSVFGIRSIEEIRAASSMSELYDLLPNSPSGEWQWWVLTDEELIHFAERAKKLTDGSLREEAHKLYKRLIQGGLLDSV